MTGKIMTDASLRSFALAFFMSAALSLTGCATNIPPERLASADYGPPPSEGYEELIKANFAQTLIDPTAPLYNFYGPPTKGYIKQSPIFNTREGFGWKICGTINSKNRMGGYAGPVPFIALLYQDRVSQRVIGEVPRDSSGFSLLNMGIDQVCSRGVD